VTLGNSDINFLFQPNNPKDYTPKHINIDEYIDSSQPTNSYSYIVNSISDHSVVLDVGCSYGYLGQWLHKHKKCTVFGLDINKEAINYIREKECYQDVFCIDLDYPEKNQDELKKFSSYSNFFDFVICADVIEHVKDPTKVLSLLGTTLKYGGQIVASIPNISNIDIILNLIEGRFNYAQFGILDNTHLRFFTEKSFFEWILYCNEYFKDFKFDVKMIGTTKYISEFCFEIKRLFPDFYNLIADVCNQHDILQYIFVLTKLNKHSTLFGFNKVFLGSDYSNIKNINSVLAEYKYTINILRSAVDEKEKEIYRLNVELNQASDKMKEIQNRLNETNHRLNQLKFELNLIHNSGFWKVALIYYKIRDNVWPLNVLYRYIKERRLKYKRHILASDSKYVSNVAQSKTKEKVKSIQEFRQLSFSHKIDIIFFSVIDWDFRYQRPQHLASILSNKGHRVFYFNSGFNAGDINIVDIKKNLKVITLFNDKASRVYDADFDKDLDNQLKVLDNFIEVNYIKDCILIVEYPSWHPIVEYLKQKYNFKVIFDYLDDFTGFNTSNQILNASYKSLMNISDHVITVSKFLYDKAVKENDNVTIIRNGTEFHHFNKAFCAIGRDKVADRRPVVGYYGAIAEWFNVDIVTFVAEKRPEWDIVLIGDTTYTDAERLRKHHNIKLMGEKSYQELPNLLSNFDVCMIPFNAETDLIKATNPVKFYEYLSAGKKVVATEIPELEEFRDKLVYLSNDKQKFLEYLELCINNKDTLEPVNRKLDFAREQDWEKRVKAVSEIIKDVHELVSIVIVTYNNLNYTIECIESIIRKTAYPNYEIIIVDNNSTDDTPKYLKNLQENYDNIHVILNDENYGFAKGNNIGIQNSSGEYIILLNNDTVVTRGWLTNLIKHLQRDDSLAMVGPVTNSIGNEAKINVDYNSIEDMDWFAEQYTSMNFNKLYTDINVLAMFCVAIKRSIIEEIGYLDESFGIGMFEDDDYSLRVIDKGYKIACAEDVFIHHYGSASFRKLQDEKYRLIFEENKKKFEDKWNRKWTPHQYRKGVN